MKAATKNTQAQQRAKGRMILKAINGMLKDPELAGAKTKAFLMEAKEDLKEQIRNLA